MGEPAEGHAYLAPLGIAHGHEIACLDLELPLVGVPQADLEAVRGGSFDPERERAEARGVEPAAWCIVPLDTPPAVAATSEAIGQSETVLARASAGIILGELYVERARRIDEHESLTAIDLRE